ncbi:MAG: hypothetical protein J6M22_04135, partial [Firmicutes bacterium]|nr:hypothetical protein [Bacillota bacterium]
MVYRIYVEKKEAFAHEAASLKNDIIKLLQIEGLKGLRVVNRYDVENLDRELFENPTSEYRGAPFWAWNGKLDREELARQIRIFRKMGMGGFHIHVRTG